VPVADVRRDALFGGCAGVVAMIGLLAVPLVLAYGL
jgi:hypothetical protein